MENNRHALEKLMENEVNYFIDVLTEVITNQNSQAYVLSGIRKAMEGDLWYDRVFTEAAKRIIEQSNR